MSVAVKHQSACDVPSASSSSLFGSALVPAPTGVAVSGVQCAPPSAPRPTSDPVEPTRPLRPSQIILQGLLESAANSLEVEHMPTVGSFGAYVAPRLVCRPQAPSHAMALSARRVHGRFALTRERSTARFPRGCCVQRGPDASARGATLAQCTYPSHARQMRPASHCPAAPTIINAPSQLPYCR